MKRCQRMEEYVAMGTQDRDSIYLIFLLNDNFYQGYLGLPKFRKYVWGSQNSYFFADLSKTSLTDSRHGSMKIFFDLT